MVSIGSRAAKTVDDAKDKLDDIKDKARDTLDKIKAKAQQFKDKMDNAAFWTAVKQWIDHHVLCCVGQKEESSKLGALVDAVPMDGLPDKIGV